MVLRGIRCCCRYARSRRDHRDRNHRNRCAGPARPPAMVRFHTLIVVALGITWVLDGLEVTIAGSIAGALQESPVLHFTAAQVGLVASAYLAGAVIGAVLFGYLTDRFGRRRLFMVTLGALSRRHRGDGAVLGFLELCDVPRADRRRHRRRVRGDQLGDPGADPGARTAAAPISRSTAASGSARRSARSARWCCWTRPAAAGLGLARRLRHRRGARARHPVLAPLGPGKPALADAARPARRVRDASSPRSSAGSARRPESSGWRRPRRRIRLVANARTPMLRMIRAIFRDYPRRALLGLVLMAVAGVLLQRDLLHLRAGADRLLRRPIAAIGWYMLPFALGNFLGPLLLGPLFDTIGRKPMIAAPMRCRGSCWRSSAGCSAQGCRRRDADRCAGCGIFFFASAAASSAYLTVSEASRSKSGRWRSRSSTRSAPASAGSPARGCSACWSAAAIALTCIWAICSAPR